MTDVLPDVLQTDLIIVFCGTAASASSAQMRAYYANPTNAFWQTLYEVGFTPHRMKAKAFRSLVDYRLGLTDVAKKVSGNDRDLSDDDFDGIRLTQKIESYQPHILAFTSKRAYRAWQGISSSKAVAYGWQDKRIGKTKLFVLPSPSGAARGYWDISIWQMLVDHYQQLRASYGEHD